MYPTTHYFGIPGHRLLANDSMKYFSWVFLGIPVKTNYVVGMLLTCITKHYVEFRYLKKMLDQYFGMGKPQRILSLLNVVRDSFNQQKLPLYKSINGIIYPGFQDGYCNVHVWMSILVQSINFTGFSCSLYCEHCTWITMRVTFPSKMTNLHTP